MENDQFPMTNDQCSGPQVNVVSFDFGVERCRVHSEQACGARLVTASLLQRWADQVDLKPAHFFVKVDAATDVADGDGARAVMMTRRNRLRIADLGAQTFFRD